MTVTEHSPFTFKRILLFLGIAAAALFVSLLPYIFRGNYLVLYDDGVRQHATFLQYMSGRNLYGGVGEFDYNIGHGGDYAVSFSYYMLFDPINLLLFILPRDNFLLSYSILIAVKFMLTATFMYVYLGKHGVRFVTATVFAVAYMLGGYMLYTFTRHPDLTAGAMYLPLVTLGLEKAIDKKPPFLLIISVFVMTASSFYMAFMVTVYAVAYAALYFVYKQKEQGKKVTAKSFFAVVFPTAAYYIIGLLLASFVLFPVAYGYLTASRGSSKGLSAYNFGELVSIAASFIFPITGAKYSPIMFSPFVILLALAAFATPKRSAHKVMAAAIAVCTFLPFVGYALNMFNYANNRFCFMLTFSAFSMIAFHINDSSDRTLNSANYIVKGSAFTLALIIDTALFACTELFTDGLSAGLKAVVYIAAVAVVLLSAFVLNIIFKKDFRSIKTLKIFNYRHLFISFAILVLAGAVAHNITYSAIFDDGTLYAALNTEAEQTVARLMEKDDEFYRLDNVTHGRWSDSENRPLNNGYRGNMIYNTMTASATGDFITSNNLLSFSTNLGMSGVNGRAALQALLACKYYRTNGDEYVPQHYKATDTKDLYVTDTYIRFGTVFGSTMSAKQYKSLPAVERQYAMLSAVTIDGGKEIEYSPITNVQSEMKNLTLSAGTSKTIPVLGGKNNELYLSFKIYDKVKAMTGFTVSCGKTNISQFLMPRGENMYTGQTDFLIKLDEHGENITITTNYGNTLHFKEVKVITADNAEILNKIEQAKSNPYLQDTKFHPNGFSGTIESDGGEMFIPITYSKGWTAYVDGKKVKVNRANVGFMSIAVPQGSHKIEFKYQTPLLNAGMIVSSVAAATALILVAVYTVRKIKQDYESIVE
ncbi:MAG: YfhO family protein [Clostridiales bacterium]|nr:YfhO family protein [Clostridiales bacterium]